MKFIRSKHLSKRLGSALVMTLVIIVLITVVTVGYLASVMLETKTAGAGLDQERAYGVAVIGMHQAMSRVRDALGPWDDPYKNFAANAPTNYWSLSPGRITLWSYTSLSPHTNIALFSESAGANLVNLNRQLADGSYPIIGGGTNPPAVSVMWVNLLRDPSKPPDATNAIIGRYAFWVDDEGAKININTADGTAKYTTNSLGIGSPSEVSLQVLQQGGATLSSSNAQNIVQFARTSNFHSPREILRASGVTPDVFTDNVFSLTAYSRSPELNVFGQPKMALLPVLGDANYSAKDMVLNGITIQPAREIYPTPSQLQNYSVVWNGKTFTNPWPLAFRQGAAQFNSGTMQSLKNMGIYENYLKDNCSYINGMMLARYLAGTNAANQPITWPAFPGSSSGGFAAKYTPRQIDSIATQICNLGAMAVSPDYPFASDVGDPNESSLRSGLLAGEFMPRMARDGASAPLVFPGFLSGQWVSGMGRSPRIANILLKFTTYASAGPLENPNPPPEASIDYWMEWWFPAGFRGSTQPDAENAPALMLGRRSYQDALNCADACRSEEWVGPGPEPPAPSPLRYPAATLLRADGSFNYWSDQLLSNNHHIDFAGNPPNRLDPDQNSAQLFHDPFARSDPANPAGPWMGTGAWDNILASPLKAGRLSTSSRWLPGELRFLHSKYGSEEGIRIPIQTNAVASGSVLEIRGGVAVLSQMVPRRISDPDPAPLEAMRGDNHPIADDFLTGESYTNSANTPGYPTVRDRAVASVIPVNANIPIPAHDSGLAETRYVLTRVEDPSVNKFPGDWEASESVGPPSTITYTLQKQSTVQYVDVYDEDATWRAKLTDPDSYWMPEIDCALYDYLKNGGLPPLIPRSARLPNVGYVQYVRTGIIPDDETGNYTQQHGTPFRLLSFAPSYENRDLSNPLIGQQTTRGASQSYPDWALLDLLYVPSTLAPFGSAYNPASTTPGTNSGVTNLLYYGTYGGATAGRINPNGTVIYTTNVDTPQAGVSRSLPMQAVFQGLEVNQTLTGAGTNSVLGGGSNVDATALAQAVADYVRTNGPLRIPAQICNIPDIANIRAISNPTRNDLVRQVVGNLATQGNVFSVWTVGQVLQKKQNNTNYGEFQAGDKVLAEVRLHFIVERYLDPGADGVYGNSANLGADAVAGTYDDPVDPVNHPFEPAYLYRVVASEEIR